MSEISLGGLTVIMGTMTYGPTWRTDGEASSRELVSGSIAKFSSFIDDLVEGWEDIVSKLHFCDGSLTHTGLKVNNQLNYLN